MRFRIWLTVVACAAALSGLSDPRAVQAQDDLFDAPTAEPKRRVPVNERYVSDANPFALWRADVPRGPGPMPDLAAAAAQVRDADSDAKRAEATRETQQSCWRNTSRPTWIAARRSWRESKSA